MIPKIKLYSDEMPEIELFPYKLEKSENTYLLNCKVKIAGEYKILNIDTQTIYKFNNKLVDEIFIIRPLTKPTPIPEKTNCLVIYLDTLDKVTNMDLLEYA